MVIIMIMLAFLALLFLGVIPAMFVLMLAIIIALIPSRRCTVVKVNTNKPKVKRKEDPMLKMMRARKDKQRGNVDRDKYKHV